MLKRQRGVSPPPPPIASYSDDSEEGPSSRPVKRVRFSGPDAWDRNSRLERAPPPQLPSGAEMTRRGSVEGRWLKGGNSDEVESQASDDDDGDSSDAGLSSNGDDEPEPQETSPYASINTLLRDLNRNRTNNQHHRAPSPAKPLHPLVPPITHGSSRPQADSTIMRELRARGPLSRSWSPSAKGKGKGLLQVDPLSIMTKHRPRVPSPLRREVEEPMVSSLQSAKGAEGSEWESEAVRARYEETNRLLKSLVLSRRRSQPGDEDFDD